MSLTQRTVTAATCAVLLSCGGKRAAEPSGGSTGYVLALIGPANLVLHPGEERSLQVLLAEDQVGPIAGGSVHFEFQDGDAAGATVDAKDVQTDANGVATVRFRAGKTVSPGGTYKLVANAPAYGTRAVAFAFDVIPPRRFLQIIASAMTQVSSDGTSGSTRVGGGNRVALRVRELDADTGAPVANDEIAFALPAAAQGSVSWAGGGLTASVPTGASGDASALLVTRSTASGPWLVTAQSTSGGAAVSFSVAVQAASGSSCSTNAQCSGGGVCAGTPPTCQPPGGGSSCDASSPAPCPFGFVCTAGVCRPPSGNKCDAAAPACGSSQCCDSITSTCKDLCPAPCAAGRHCQASATCGAGTCVADDSAPDVTGLWLTRHDFSIREALPAAVQDVARSFRLLDQALHGKLTVTGVGWIDQVINGVLGAALQQYLPDWLQRVVQIGDTLLTLLSNLRSEGSMHLTAGVDSRHLNGTEVWTNLVFYFLPLCNGEISGDPAAPPACARMDLATTDAESSGEVVQCKGQSLPSIAVQVAPFTAAVVPAGTGYQLTVSTSRQVRLKMGKVLLALVDQIIAFTTPYHCIEEVTACTAGSGNCPLLDCNGLAQDVANTGWVTAAAVERACDAAVSTAGKLVTNVLVQVWSPTADVLDFTGHATISGTASDPATCEAGGGACAAQIGNDRWDKDLNTDALRAGRDGAWNGDFFFKLVHKLPGAWSATRP